MWNRTCARPFANNMLVCSHGSVAVRGDRPEAGGAAARGCGGAGRIGRRAVSQNKSIFFSIELRKTIGFSLSFFCIVRQESSLYRAQKLSSPPRRKIVRIPSRQTQTALPCVRGSSVIWHADILVSKATPGRLADDSRGSHT